MRARFCFVLATATLTAACAQTPDLATVEVLPPLASPDRKELAPAGTYTHAASGMIFPEAVGAFRRYSVARFGSDGLKISASYDSEDSSGRHISVTAYVYPSPDIAAADDAVAARREQCDYQFREAHGEVVNARALGWRPVPSSVPGRGEIVLTRGDAEYDGLTATYFEVVPVDVVDTAEPASQLHLFCYVGGQWTVKYRVFASPLEAIGIEDLMTELMLTIGPQERDETL